MLERWLAHLHLAGWRVSERMLADDGEAGLPGDVVTIGPLLETKLHIPRPPRGMVARPRLGDRLSRGLDSALTLISAPAGFGKTTVATEWFAALPVPGPSTAWLSLDERDNDPMVFWTYVVAALRTAAGDEFGASALALVQSSQAPLDAVVASLVNELCGVTDEVVLVLDDYHLIEAPEVHAGVAFLLERLPPQIHLVIATRMDPPVPLARLRADGRLTELRSTDLRFTSEESATYLRDVAGTGLSAADVTSLEERTEGWIAALQLAALSIKGRDDISSFIAEFAGDDRYIVDYLSEEVLARQGHDVRQFLLRTSILDRLTGASCDAVTGQDGGKARLAELERANLFLVPLDDRRRWFRYHHLFADVLRAHLLDEQPAEVIGLHRRASAWYEANGDPSEAIHHALAAADFEHAADLAEGAIPALQQRRQESTIRAWQKLIPEEVVRVRPVLNIGFVGALVSGGQLDGIEDRLRDIERWLETGAEAGAGEMVVVDEARFRFLRGAIELYRTALALVRGDLAATMTHARRVLDLSPEGDDVGRAAAAGLLGLASWASGDLEGGYQAYAECVAGLRRAGHSADILGCSIALADIRRTQGRLGEALRINEDAVQPAGEQGGPVLRGTADMEVGMSEVHLERNDLAAARECLLRSQRLGDHNGLPQNPYRWRVAMARIHAAEGDFDAALDLLDDAQRAYISDFFPDVRPVPAWRARVRVAQGELADAIAWARQRGLAVADDLRYLQEFEHVTLARILLARSRIERSEHARHEATGLLDRLLAAAEAGGRTGSVIEILVLRALAHDASGDAAAALDPLQRAVTLAQPEAYVRVFADEGPAMAALLRSLGREGDTSYVDRLIAAADPTGQQRPRPQPLIDPLSERELQVLRLLGTDLNGPAIARELTVSLNTMRSHTKSIYAKLGVNSRRAAVRRGESLALLARGAHG